VSALLAMLVRALYHVPRPSFALDMKHAALAAIATGVIGPLMWRIFRRIDAAYARTQRERDAALEGLTP
jgi:hypothetical protein